MSMTDASVSAPNPPADSQSAPGQWRVVAASVQGTSHQKTGQPCQDAHHSAVSPHGVLIAAVADGAGSASMSEVGAAIASKVAAESIYTAHLASAGQDAPDDEAWKQRLLDALQAARAAVEAEADQRAVAARELATTLILVMATPQLVAAAQVGDGAAVINDSEGNITALTIPQSGEFINETTFIISPDALPTAQVKVWRGTATQIAVFSDGLQMLALKLPEGIPHTPFFVPLFHFAAGMADATDAHEQLEAFLCSPRIRERADDDLTLLLASLQ